jgi:hypothetical protein
MINPYYRRRHFAIFIVVVAFLSVLSTSISSANALTESEDETVAVSVSSVLTLTVTPVVGNEPSNIVADASVSDGLGTGSTDVFVGSNNQSGAVLQLNMISTDTDNGKLVSGTVLETIDPTAGGASLGTNKWGYYAYDLVGAPPDPITWAAVPASASPATIYTSSATGEFEYRVTYGAQVDYTLPGGATYSNQVTYTASTNP